MTPVPVIIDCDPGVDDAVALFLAFAAREALGILAVTTVAGNVPLSLTARNARIIRSLAGREDVPVHAGCPRPILRAPVTAEEFHGQSGLEGISLFEPDVPLAPSHAVTAIIETVRASAAPVTIVITGPMTNVALAIVSAPDILSGLDRIIVMGGADAEGGNITPFSEFNIHADPHAARIVFGSGARIVALSLDATHQIRTTPDRIASLSAAGHPRLRHVASLLRAINRLELAQNGASAAPLHDPATIAFLLGPELFSGRQVSVDVVTGEGPRFGQTRLTGHAEGRVTWIDRVDAAGVYALMAGWLARP